MPKRSSSRQKSSRRTSPRRTNGGNGSAPTKLQSSGSLPARRPCASRPFAPGYGIVGAEEGADSLDMGQSQTDPVPYVLARDCVRASIASARDAAMGRLAR